MSTAAESHERRAVVRRSLHDRRRIGAARRLDRHRLCMGVAASPLMDGVEMAFQKVEHGTSRSFSASTTPGSHERRAAMRRSRHDRPMTAPLDALIAARRSWLSGVVLAKKLLDVPCSTFQKPISTASINGEAAVPMQSRSSAMPLVAQHGYARHDVEDGPIARIGQW